MSEPRETTKTVPFNRNRNTVPVQGPGKPALQGSDMDRHQAKMARKTVEAEVQDATDRILNATGGNPREREARAEEEARLMRGRHPELYPELFAKQQHPDENPETAPETGTPGNPAHPTSAGQTSAEEKVEQVAAQEKAGVATGRNSPPVKAPAIGGKAGK